MLHPLLAVVYKVMKYVRVGIKCTIENIYNYSTHSSSIDWLKAFRKRKGRANLG
jgi:hypothetical protein